LGFITGICSKDKSNISELLYKMAFKLKHRGNSNFCIIVKGNNGWEITSCDNIMEILNTKTYLGIVGTHNILDERYECTPYCDCSGKNSLMLDGRIFNLNQIKSALKVEHRINLNNSGIILHLFEELARKNLNISDIFKKIFDNINGMFATTLIFNDKVFLFRDLVGIKPLYLHGGPKYFEFASEKQAFWIIGIKNQIRPLLPGEVVQFTENGFIPIYQANLNHYGVQNKPFEYYQQNLIQLLKGNLSELIPNNLVYLLLSGGIDSSIIAALLQKMDVNFRSLVLGSEKSKDIIAAQEVSEYLKIPLEILSFDTAVLEETFPILLYALENTDEKKINIAFPLYYASKFISSKGSNVIFTGQGADELFGGYERHEIQFQKNQDKIQSMLWDDIKNMYEVNLQRDDAASMAYRMELRLPYLCRNFIEFSMKIPAQFKIKPPIRKYILRRIGAQLGLSDNIIKKRKKALQFSSGSYDTLKKLSRQLGFTKDFALKNGFFSPTQLFINSLALFLGFPNINPKIIRLFEKSRINWPESFFKYKNLANKII